MCLISSLKLFNDFFLLAANIYILNEDLKQRVGRDSQYLNLIPKMSSPNRRRETRNIASEYFSSIRPPNMEDLDKEALLFPDENSEFKPEYLEEPIKVDGSLRPRPQTRSKKVRLHNSSNQSSEHQENKDEGSSSSYQFGFGKMDDEELDDLMNNHNQINPIESNSMPYLDLNPFRPSQINYRALFEEPEIKLEVEHSDQPILMVPQMKVFDKPAELDEKKNHPPTLEQEKRALLFLDNSFKAVNAAMKVTYNYHKISNRESLNRSFSSIFNVFTKEGKKLQNAFEVEVMRIDSLIQVKKEDNARREQTGLGMTKELVNTGSGDDDKVKNEEAIEPANRTKDI